MSAYINSLRRKYVNMENGIANAYLSRKQLCEIYCVSIATIKNAIANAIKNNKELEVKIKSKRFVTKTNMVVLLDFFGRTTEKYPNCILKKDICEAYGMNYDLFKFYIIESKKLDEEFKKEINHTKILFPKHLEKIEKAFGEPNISITEMCIKRQNKFYNR